MIKIREAIVVEGKYDKNTLLQVVDAPVFQTNGFGLRKDKTLVDLLRRVAKERGLIVLTDADSGGFMIRNFIKSVIPPQYLKHAYIPDIQGKEKRKDVPGKEGKLGVEGMTPQVLEDCLRRAGATIEGETFDPSCQITKQDFVQWGLSGGQDSSEKRKRLLKKLSFPERMTANAMLQAVNLLYTRAEFVGLLEIEND